MECRRFTKNECDFIAKNGDYYGVTVCANKLNRTARSVSGKMKRLVGHATWKCSATQEEIDDLLFNDEWRELNLDFETTQTPKELAYFLGYFWADGYIDPHGALVMEIKNEDSSDIFEIMNRLATFKIYGRKREGRKEQTTFRYQYDKENTELLRFLGKYSNSIENHEKILSYIPNNFRVYFLRGLFDGDGCIYLTKTKYLATQITVSGRYDMDWSYLVDFLKEKYNINFKIIRRKSSNTSKYSQILSTNSKENRDFLMKLYEDNDGIWLNRKYNKAKVIINHIFSSNDNPAKRDKIKDEFSVLVFDKHDPILVKKQSSKILVDFESEEKITQLYENGDRVVDKFGNVLVINGVENIESTNIPVYTIIGTNNGINEIDIIGKFIRYIKKEELKKILNNE